METHFPANIFGKLNVKDFNSPFFTAEKYLRIRLFPGNEFQPKQLPLSWPNEQWERILLLIFSEN